MSTNMGSGAKTGSTMSSEMAEQPQVLARLAARFDSIAGQVRAAAAPDGPVKGVAFLARGSSDNSALLGRYAIEQRTGLPTSLVAPSIVTVYRQAPELYRGWLLVALSQSGRTPEIVDIAARYAACGATVAAVTNDPDSALARAARLHVSLDAGPELAVPATKTVTSQMLAILAIAAGLTDESETAGFQADVDRIPAASATILADPEPVERVAKSLAEHRRLAVVGRGACYPAALETALKLQETLGVMAHGFSSADFRHGPIAVCGPDAPAVLLAGSGPADDDTRALRSDLSARDARVIEFGTGPAADAEWPALGSMAECILATIRGQQLASALAARLGIDPDEPTGLNKVTLTH
ncbi:SIS domain-containing protein [Actinospica sp. MGRD01-02]|uniref:SIS domain-containing protein n=1 Tax=Actinospica acidithermotolerans TaxID=2828514 RepID=A0A941IHV1_9ACTN|nr:SIS domain-containing protein [Actinospica acidithermotolerans]MBR7825538.1 SIS domain-containing protein [Actinospica acidithermotolerans]